MEQKEFFGIFNFILKTQMNRNEVISPITRIEELNFDSLSLMTLIVYLEDRCEIEIDIDDLKDINELSISDFYKRIYG